MAGGRRSDRKGRSTGVDPFVMLPQWAFDCPAYRTLKPGPRALLWEIIRKHNGANNGRIGFSQRDMAVAINVTDRETVAGYVRDLEARGFIAATRRGGFNVKVADRRSTEWELTWIAVGEVPPTKAFMRWRPNPAAGTGKPAPQGGETVPSPLRIVRACPNVPEKPSVTATPVAVFGTEKPSTYTSLATGQTRKRGGE